MTYRALAEGDAQRMEGAYFGTLSTAEKGRTLRSPRRTWRRSITISEFRGHEGILGLPAARAVIAGQFLAQGVSDPEARCAGQKFSGRGRGSPG